MSLLKVFDVAGSALSAQSLRLNITASNLANAETLASSAEAAYKARQPVFKAVLDQFNRPVNASVRMVGVVEAQSPNPVRHEPEHPLADADGNVFASNVNPVEEMANMISASRGYQSNVEVINTSKQLLLRTLSMGE